MGILWLSRADVLRAGGGDPRPAMPLIESALLTHAAGDSSQPLKPYLRIPGDTRSRRIIAMPAYLGGDFQTWGLKWIASAPDNPARRGLERASAIIVLNDVETGQPVAMMEGAQISATRTAAVALIAAKYLARREPSVLACIGNGLIGTMITANLAEATPSLAEVRLYDQVPAASESLADKLRASGGPAVTVASGPEEAMAGADLVATATTVAEPYIEGDWVHPGCLFLNVSLRDPKSSVAHRADKLVVDEWDQVNRGGTLIHRMTEAGELDRSGLHGELADVIAGDVAGREHDAEIIVFSPMGLSIYDISTAWGVHRRAVELGLGVELEST